MLSLLQKHSFQSFSILAFLAIMAFENFKPKYLFNLGKYVTRINKTYIVNDIWSIIHHKKEENRKIKFSKFGPAGLEPTQVPDKGQLC